jgi:hypothetical protein
VEWLPINAVEDVNIGPAMMFAEIQAVGGKTTQAAELGRDVVCNSDGTDLQGTDTGGEERNQGGRIEESGGNGVTPYVELYPPREIFYGSALVLVTMDVMECDRDREPRENRKNLELNVSFRVKMVARVRVAQIAAGRQAFDQTLTVGIVFELRDPKGKLEILVKVEKAKQSCQHLIRFGAE